MTLTDDERALLTEAITHGHGCLRPDEECCNVSLDDLTPAIVQIAHARALPFIEQVREYSNAITWDTTCLNCSRLMDKLYEADMRREIAEQAANTCGGCAGLGSHRRNCPHHPNYHPWRALAEQAEEIGDRVGGTDPALANQAYALSATLTAHIRMEGESCESSSPEAGTGTTEF